MVKGLPAMHEGNINAMNERRDSQRVPVTLDAVLNYQAQVMICTIRDISLNGAFIEARRKACRISTLRWNWA